MTLIYRLSGIHHVCIVLGLLLIPTLSFSQQQDDYIQTVELIEATANLNEKLRRVSETACAQLTSNDIEAVIDLRKTLNARKPADANHTDDLEMAVLYAKLSELSKSKPVTNLKSDAQNAKTVSLALVSKLNINLSEDELLRELNSEKNLGCKLKEEL